MVDQKKKCKVCGNYFLRPAVMWDSKWAERKCCSKKCAAYRPKGIRVYKLETKPCAVCGKLFNKPEKDDPYDWKKRKCCGPECAKIARNVKKQNRFTDMTEEELRSRISAVRQEKEARGEVAFGDKWEEVDFSRRHKVLAFLKRSRGLAFNNNNGE